MDPQTATLVATALGGLLGVLGTLGGTWLNNRHLASMAEADRRTDAARRREERDERERQDLEARREAAADKVRAALKRAVEAVAVCEVLRLEVQAAREQTYETPLNATALERGQRITAVLAEFGQVSAEMSAFGGDLALHSRSLLEAAREALNGHVGGLTIEPAARFFEHAAREWLEAHARVALGGTTPAQTAPNETQR